MYPPTPDRHWERCEKAAIPGNGGAAMTEVTSDGARAPRLLPLHVPLQNTTAGGFKQGFWRAGVTWFCFALQMSGSFYQIVFVRQECLWKQKELPQTVTPIAVI